MCQKTSVRLLSGLVVALFEFGVPCLFGLLMPIDPRQENCAPNVVWVLGLGTESLGTATRHELSLIGVVSVVARHLLPPQRRSGQV